MVEISLKHTQKATNLLGNEIQQTKIKQTKTLKLNLRSFQFVHYLNIYK